MSRARDLANLGDQAGSGLDASDITTGTLGNTVQDNITRLGTVTTGTLKNTIHSEATFPSKMVVKTENVTSTTQVAVINDGVTVLLVCTFVRVSASSHFVLFGHVHLGAYNDDVNQDANDPRILLRENNAGAGESTINVNNNITSKGFYRSDVPMWRTSVNYLGLYDLHNFPFAIKRSLSGSVGDSIDFKIRIQAGHPHSDNAGYGAFTNRAYDGNGLSGSHSSLTVMEIIN